MRCTRTARAPQGPFIKINCAALPKELIEAELFGYRRGAFTGAFTDKAGLLAMAEGGSLLLDEIGEMPSYLQAKLLRVLQEREFRPIGSDRSVRVDFRLICATNVDVESALREGRLREDLYFRINTITVRVPALRERLEDVAPLCQHFLALYNGAPRPELRGVSPAAYHRLMQHRWPGNIRELENVIERGVLVARGQDLQPEDLPESVVASAGGGADRARPAAGHGHARRDRADGHPAGAAADQLEQAGRGAAARALPSDAVQQDEEARHHVAAAGPAPARGGRLRANRSA